MAYRTEKNGQDTDIVIDGFEQGIATSPHKGLANLQGGNISTETGEILASSISGASVTYGGGGGGAGGNPVELRRAE